MRRILRLAIMLAVQTPPAEQSKGVLSQLERRARLGTQRAAAGSRTWALCVAVEAVLPRAYAPVFHFNRGDRRKAWGAGKAIVAGPRRCRRDARQYDDGQQQRAHHRWNVARH